MIISKKDIFLGDNWNRLQINDLIKCHDYVQFINENLYFGSLVVDRVFLSSLTPLVYQMCG